ncbi:hypothetical protein [Mucilaginibacter sp. HD30]
MKKILSLLCAYLLTIAAYGQTWQPKQLKEDFDTLRHALEEAHGGLYRFHSKADMDHMFTQQRKALENPLGQYAFYARLSKLLAYIGDGHMKLDMNTAGLKPLFFPFQVVGGKDKVFILTNDTPDNMVIKPGMELLSINGRTMADIRQLILPCLIGDGYNTSGKYASLERSFSQNYWLFADTTSMFRLRVKDADGKIYQATIKGVKQRAAYRQPRQKPG